MKRAVKLILIGALSAVAASAFAGCSLGVTKESVIHGRNLTAQVTYYANGGNFGSADNTVKEIYFQSGNPAIPIGDENLQISSGSVEIAYQGHIFAGWRYAKLGEDGLPSFTDEKKTMPVTHEDDLAVDFSRRLEEGDHWYIYAKWETEKKLEVRLKLSEGESITAGTGESAVTFENGYLFSAQSFGPRNTVQQPTGASLSADLNTVATFAEFYVDEACTTPASWPFTASEGENNDVVYAMFVPGKWTIIKNSTNFKEARFNMGSNRYYLLNDVDCADITITDISQFAATLEGNGHTIRNLKAIHAANSSTVTNNVISMFGTIRSTAVIKNVNFEDVTFQVATGRNRSVEVCLIAAEIQAGAEIDNVAFSGTLDLTVSLSDAIVYNIQGQEDDFILAKGYTDAAFAALPEWNIDLSRIHIIDHRNDA